MALATINKLTSDDGLVFLKPTDRCFYCSQQLGGTHLVYWQGTDERAVQIWLHPECAKRMADHLVKDWHRFNSGLV